MKPTRIKRTLLAVLFLILAILFFRSFAHAQADTSPKGILRGAVSTAAPDGQSYNVPGASLKLKSQSKSLDAVTDDVGEYQFKDISPGEYTIEVSVQGFKIATKSISIAAGETKVENVSLEVAGVSA